MSADSTERPVSTSQDLGAAFARTATRALALYFSRPVRLFRPSKVSGWHALRASARRDGSSLTPQYVRSLLKSQGIYVIAQHFIPPLIVNAALGTILWTTYSVTHSALQTHIHNTLAVSALAGGVAGGIQALAAAPAENVRIVLEGGSQHAGWTDAWKEVFLATKANQDLASQATMQRTDARLVREWMREVRGTAGRGWDGWRWTCAKDSCGFATFFSIFEVSRKAASHSALLVEQSDVIRCRVKVVGQRVARATTLITGGVVAGFCYEAVCRPWDNARKIVHLHQISAKQPAPIPQVLMQHLKEYGIFSLFKNTNVAATASADRGLALSLRTLARVGPWGVGFLVWEAVGNQSR